MPLELDALAHMAEAFSALYADRAVPVHRVAADAVLGGNTGTSRDPKLFALYAAAGLALKGNALTAPALGIWFRLVEGRVVDGRTFVRSGGGKARRKVALLALPPTSMET